MRISDWSSDVCSSDLAVFPPLGYASAALKSYRTFEQLLADGKIASGTRFMVALPTPFAPMMSFIEPGSFEAIEPRYGAAIRREFTEVMAPVPSEQLALQWVAERERSETRRVGEKLGNKCR